MCNTKLYKPQEYKLLCFEAIEKCGYAIEGMKLDMFDLNEKKEIYLAGLSRYGLSVRSIDFNLFTEPEDRKELCMAAVKNNGYAIKHIDPKLFSKDDLFDIYEAALKETGYAIKYVDMKLFTPK